MQKKEEEKPEKANEFQTQKKENDKRGEGGSSK